MKSLDELHTPASDSKENGDRLVSSVLHNKDDVAFRNAVVLALAALAGTVPITPAKSFFSFRPTAGPARHLCQWRTGHSIPYVLRL
jgi:hypothetical protein